MTSKLPEGIPVYINPHGLVWTADVPVHQHNGIAFTFKQLSERDRAIARAAWDARSRDMIVECDNPVPIDDYLQSDEFLSLIRGKK
jgi:hypothetical protein